MGSFHVKKNDDVVVISGPDKGRRGKIIAVNGKTERVIVEGAHMLKKHVRKSQQHPQGTILEREGPIHISNVMKAALHDARQSKRGASAPAA